MKRTLATLVLGLATVGFVGCGQEAGTESTTTTTDAGGTTEVTTEKSIETTGDNPPPPGAPAAPATGTEAPK